MNAVPFAAGRELNLVLGANWTRNVNAISGM